MTSLGEVRSPLEAPVQELCNARLVEVMCTWTNGSLQFPPANSVYGLLPSGPRLTLIRRPRSSRSQTNPALLSGKVVPDKSNLAETISPIGLRSPSITGTKRKSEGFLIALRAMGLAVVEQLPQPAKPPVRGEKP